MKYSFKRELICKAIINGLFYLGFAMGVDMIRIVITSLYVAIALLGVVALSAMVACDIAPRPLPKKTKEQYLVMRLFGAFPMVVVFSCGFHGEFVLLLFTQALFCFTDHLRNKKGVA